MQGHNRQLADSNGNKSISGAASWTSEWVAVGAGGWRTASFTTAWGAGASTAGALGFEGTDDPDKAAGSVVPLTTAVSHGTFPTVGATAGKALVVLTNCPGYVRQVYTRSAGGVADQFKSFVTVTE